MVYQVPYSVENAIGEALDNIKELSSLFVQDSAGNVYWLEVNVDETDGSVTYTFFDQPGGTQQIPVGDVGPIPDSNINVIPRCDDVNNDGSDLVTFYRINVTDELGNVIASNPTTADGSSYLVVGTEVDCKEGESRQVASNDSVITSDFTIPAGFLHGSIMVLEGTAEINGAEYQSGDGLDLPPMSHGNHRLTYGAYAIDNFSATGQVRINYHV